MFRRTFRSFIFYIALMPLIGVATVASAQQGESAAQPTTASPAVEQSFNGLRVKVLSLRVSSPDQRYASRKSQAHITLQMSNETSEPFALGYLMKSAQMVESHGYVYDTGTLGDKQMSGAGEIASNTADVGFELAPGQSRNVRISVYRNFGRGQTVGDSFDFDAEFRALLDAGEGKVKTLKKFNISFVGLKPATGVEATLGETKDSLGGALKSLFGK